MPRRKRKGAFLPPPLPIGQFDLVMSHDGLMALNVILNSAIDKATFKTLPVHVRTDIENLRNEALARLQRYYR